LNPAPQIKTYPAKKLVEYPLFSILIPTWNNLAYLQLCIKSIHQNSRFKHQIIIHVNEGNDGTREWVDAADYAYTYSEENVGVCYALNSSSKLVTTNYILYINDDMFVGKDWDYYLMQAIEAKGDEYFYYSGTMVEFENSGNAAVLSPYDFGRDYDTFDEDAFNKLVESKPKPDWFGACWPPSIVHKKIWDLAKGYDVAYSPGFYSDPDFAMKIWQLGVRDFKGIGGSMVYHFKCKSTGRVVRNNGRKTFAKKWGISSSFLYKQVLKLGDPFQENVQLKFPIPPLLWLNKIKAFYIANF
jgi:glycosyltransferase involved in cell wall biosynthesis